MEYEMRSPNEWLQMRSPNEWLQMRSPGERSATRGYYHRDIETAIRKFLIHFNLGKSYCNQ